MKEIKINFWDRFKLYRICKLEKQIEKLESELHRMQMARIAGKGEQNGC